MNKDRRAALERAKQLVAEAQAIIEEAASDERDYFDNMPESLQGSEKGEQANAAADALDEALDALSSIDDLIDQVVQ